MEQKYETSLPSPDASSQSRVRGGYLGYPNLDTLNRKANQRTDAVRKIRYFRKLIIRLDGDIGDRELTLRERCLYGQPDDLAECQLEIDRLKHLRSHSSALLEFIEEDPLEEPTLEDLADSDAFAPLPTPQPDPDEPIPTDDDLLTVEELSKLIKKSPSTIYKWTSAKMIPYFKIGSANRFRRGEIKEWIKEQARKPL